MKTEELVDGIKEWAMELVDSKNKNDQIADRLAIISEFHEWFDINRDEIEIVALDEISEQDYNDFVDYMNDGIERG